MGLMSCFLRDTSKNILWRVAPSLSQSNRKALILEENITKTRGFIRTVNILQLIDRIIKHSYLTLFSL